MRTACCPAAAAPDTGAAAVLAALLLSVFCPHAPKAKSKGTIEKRAAQAGLTAFFDVFIRKMKQ
jgi:hypothetical protein